MKGSQILVSAFPKGIREEGIIGVGLTLYPGIVVQRDYSVALLGGRFTWKAYTPGANGGKPIGPLIVLLDDPMQGRIYSTPYAAGDHAFGMTPQEGDEFNMLFKDVAGTGDVHSTGQLKMPESGSGKLLAVTGSPDLKPFTLQETLGALTADTLGWCVYSGK